jgi:arginine decarboxylase
MSQNRMRRIDQFLLFYSARADGWRDLVGKAQEWASGVGDLASVKNALGGMGLEEFHAFPGAQMMRSLKQLIESEDAASTAALVRRISEVILADGDPSEALEVRPEQTEGELSLVPTVLAEAKRRRPYFETLFVSEQPPQRWPSLGEQLRHLRRAEDQFVYEPVFVNSF